VSPVSRRSLLLGGAAIAATAGSLPTSTASAEAVARPSGADYIRYEDLYRSGDTVSQALARLREPKVVTFPEGKFECRDFNSGYQAGISVPALCRGIVGSGRGTLGGSSGTVFTIKARSSTKGYGAKDSSGHAYVPKQDNKTPCQLVVLKQLGQKAPSVWRHFQVAGTEQGHIFNGFQVYGTAGANKFEDLLITGWDGDAGAPPGETYGIAVSGPGAHRLSGIEVDGRRTPGGPAYGAMGMTAQNTVGVTFTGCYSHYTRAAGFVAFQSVNGLVNSCHFDARVASDRAVGNGGMNFERTAGWRLVSTRVTGRSRKVHITHSNDRWTLKQSGKSHSVANGKLTIIDPKFNDLWGNDYLMIQSWTPYWSGDTMKTAPLVVKKNGKSKIPYAWVHGKSRLVH
jgi:hypothetical protein